MSHSRRSSYAWPVAALLAAAACQSVDVGQPCTMNLEFADGGPIAVSVGGAVECSADSGDFLRTGALECDGLVCLQSATGACSGQTGTPFLVRSYCSKACVSNSDCFTSQTGLVCRAVLPEPAFLASLPDGGAPYIPATLQSNYCAPPLVQ